MRVLDYIFQDVRCFDIGKINFDSYDSMAYRGYPYTARQQFLNRSVARSFIHINGPRPGWHVHQYL